MLAGRRARVRRFRSHHHFAAVGRAAQVGDQGPVYVVVAGEGLDGVVQHLAIVQPQDEHPSDGSLRVLHPLLLSGEAGRVVGPRPS